MSIRAMHSAASGMGANALNLDMIANNLANAGTTGYKRARANFEDLFYDHIKLPGTLDSNSVLTPTGIEVGMGTRVSSTQSDFGPGALLQTSGDFDMAIVGDGFFQVQDGSEVLYTRAGNFTLNADGAIVMASADRGRLLEPAITLPTDAEQISISADGIISYKQAGSPALQQVGPIQLARFVNSQGLVHRGENLFAQSDASGQPLVGNPGQEGRGSIRHRTLEISNVEPVRELVELIKTQRNFELNSQVVQAADQTLQLIANLRRF